MKYFVSTFILFSSITAAAATTQVSLRARQVAQLFYSANCDKSSDGKCQRGVSFQQFRASEIRQLPKQARDMLFKRAYDQAQIWGDTILEGEYAADGNTQLNVVTLIRKQNTVVGFAVTYSEKAWFTGDCMYDSSRPESLKSCELGRITETSFVSTDMREAAVDENQFASFSSRD